LSVIEVGKKMIPDVSRTKLLQALEEYDSSLGDAPEWTNWESKDTYKYAIVHDDKRYPVKQIIRMATGATDFSGGEEANNYVTKRGLSVVPLNASAEKDSLGLRDGLEEIMVKYASARASEPFGRHELRTTFKGVSDAIMATYAVSERPSLRVTWSIGQGQWVTIPWIALLDARETDTTQRGAHGVYLFREDMSGVYLAFAQGVTVPKDWYSKATQAREYLRTQAADLRRYCEDLRQQGFALDNDLDLHTDAGLGKDYEASTTAHKFYAAGSVPDDQLLISDLETVLSAYDLYLEDPGSRLWCIYAGRSAATNLELARASGVWGADKKAKFEGIKKDDSVWFVHDLVTDVSPAPDGFPRVKLREFRGIAKLAVLGKVVSDVFEDSSRVWPDGTYPFRFNFEEIHEDHEVLLNSDTFPPGVGNAIRRSAISQGRPFLTREWRATVLDRGGPLGEDAESLFSVDTFDLLAGLHDDPTKAYYQEHREAIRDHVEEPFRWLVRQASHRLPAPITGLMETEKGVFAKILKNDYGRGGSVALLLGGVLS
jgi:hypothetical protein